MRRRKVILLSSYAIAGFVVLGTIALTNYMHAVSYKLQLENTYQHAFSELASSVSELDIALQKTLYATTPAMLGSISTEVYGKAQTAQGALGEIPFSTYEFKNMAGFITKVGDYAYALSKKAWAGAAVTEEEHQNLVSLSDTSSVLSGNLNQLMADLGSQGVSSGRLGSVIKTAAKIGDEATSGFLKSSLTTMEGEFPETPSLIYDGPFSSHIAGLKPKMLEGKPLVSKEEALKKAASFMGLKESDLKADGEREGNLPVYIYYANSDGGTVSVEVTKYGGLIADAFNSRIIGNSIISPKDAVKIAARFLERKGYRHMVQSYEINENRTLVINFAFSSNGVICYPDLVKVSVALDNGRIVGFESQGYIMNHTNREIEAAKISDTEARSKVSPYLKILAHQMAIVPTSGKNEVLCHEFKCENEKGIHYIVYINALTGGEEKILILQENENGTLTI